MRNENLNRGVSGMTSFGVTGFLFGIIFFGILVVGQEFAHAESSLGAEVKQDSSATAPRIYQYTVRGQIRQFPKSPSGEVFIRHEPIPDYVGRDGTVVGMRAMTMPFWLAEDVSLEGLSVGDTVEFVMRSQWQPKAKDTIIALKKIQ